MKLLKVLALVLVAAVVLSSCYWTGNLGQGGLTIDLSQIQAKTAGDMVRVYLFADGKLFSTGGGVPFSAQVVIAPYPDETKVSIQGLPVGPQYQALLGVGPMSGGVFAPNSYGKSGLFQVSPGTDTTVPIPLIDLTNYPFLYLKPNNGIYFSSDLMGKNLKDVVSTGSYRVYTAEESRLHLMSFNYDSILLTYVLSVSDSYDLESSFPVNSLSNDGAGLASEAFINSTNGILSFNRSEGWGFDPTFSIDLEGEKNILESADFFDGTYFDFFFRRANGLGGFSTLASSWINQDVPGVLDLAVSDNNAYFATKSGAFALPPAFLQDLTPTLAEHKMPFSAPADIVSLDFLPTIAFAGGTLYMGTTDGVWEAFVDEASGVNVGTATQIPETAGQKIEHIAVSRYNPSVNQAFLSNYWLYIRYYTTVYEIPFFAVLPGKPTGMAWDSSGVLYISGTEGLSSVYVGAC